MVDNLRVKFKGQIKNFKGQRIRLSDSFIKTIYETRG